MFNNDLMVSTCSSTRKKSPRCTDKVWVQMAVHECWCGRYVPFVNLELRRPPKRCIICSTIKFCAWRVAGGEWQLHKKPVAVAVARALEEPSLGLM